MVTTLFAYPGGKTKLARPILSRLNENPIAEYREPFLGGGAVGLNVMKAGTPNCWINDKDPSVWALWNSVACRSEELKKQVLALEPSIEFYRCAQAEVTKHEHTKLARDDIVQVAIAKLALQKMSYSSLGLMAGGPKGGWRQVNKSIAARWSAESICKRIDAVAPALSRCRITCGDFADMLESDGRATIYLDPPYFHAGARLYRHAFTLADHVRLRDVLLYSPHNWLLSYDDCAEVRELYAFVQIDELPVSYSIRTRRQSVELLISPRSQSQTFLAMAAEDGQPIRIRRAGENWHSDMCYAARPPLDTMLYAVEVRVIMRSSISVPGARKRAFTLTQAEIDCYPPVRLFDRSNSPLHRSKCLYGMRDDCAGIACVDQEKADALIADHIVKRAFVYRTNGVTATCCFGMKESARTV